MTVPSGFVDVGASNGRGLMAAFVFWTLWAKPRSRAAEFSPTGIEYLPRVTYQRSLGASDFENEILPRDLSLARYAKSLP